MQKGVSVQMATTSNATTMPDADSADAKIVAVTAPGSIYFGVDPITLADLTEKVRSTPFRRGQKLYIKADARTTYAKVLRVLDATDIGEIAPPVLLTAQPQSSAAGTIVPPKGLEVLRDPPPGTQPLVVQLVDFGQKEPELEVDDQTVSYAELPGTLRQLLQNASDKVVRVKAEGRLPFAEVVRLIDACESAGAKVVVGSAGV
jgi:biopolymer transport protein ExbD